MMRRPLLVLGLLLLLGSCSDGPFSPFPRCEVDCALPPTVGPTLNWVHPRPNGPVRATDLLHVSATDDIGVAYVEVYWVGFKVHAGVLAGAPYTVLWNGYLRASIGYLDGDPVTFMAVATDMEGNADTSFVTARFASGP